MDNRIQVLVEKIKKLESEIAEELQKKEAEFFYNIRDKKVSFDKEIKKQHKLFLKKVSWYLRDADLLTILTVPFIWACLFPTLFLDVFVSLYQAVCFPVYGIPKVKRGKYIVIDRHSLSYLNFIEKLNCIYCGYVNGFLAYLREVAARTEQYWCPIKHARRTKSFHSRYNKFLEYGDAEGYRKKIEKIRRDFEDLQ